MTYRLPLPTGARSSHLDLLEPNSTAVQRFIRRHGLGLYETPTCAAVLAWCEAHDPGFVMFDVGANMGLYSAIVTGMFSPAEVHAFEPTPDTARVAKKVARKNRLPMVVHEIALSDRVGTATLHINPKADTSNSLVEGFRTDTIPLQIPVRTLDDVVQEIGPPQLIKIDVETHERAVLDGGRRTFETARPTLIIEVLRRAGNPHGKAISAYFESLGYHFYRVTADTTWEPEPEMYGSGSNDRDWLVSPDPLPEDFATRWEVWNERLLACDASQNPRVPLILSAIAAFKRGGPREVVASARRSLGRSDGSLRRQPPPR